MRTRSTSSWIIVPMLVSIALFGLVFSATSAVQDSSSELDKVNSLFSVLEGANATVVKVFRQFEVKGVTVPQKSLDQYDQALLLAGEATVLMQAGNYSEASVMIVEALQGFKESLKIIYSTVNVQPTDFETNVETAIALNSSIDRCYEQLFQIENATGVAKANGFNTTLLETKIGAATSLLEEAVANLDKGNLEAASGNIAAAKALIGDLSISLSELAVDLKVERLSAYIAETEVRLDALRARAVSVSNTAPLAYVNQAESSLSSAKEYLAQELINQTLAELADSRNSELQAEAILKPTLSSTGSITGSSLTVAAIP